MGILTLVVLCGLAASTRLDADRPPGPSPAPRGPIALSTVWEQRTPLPRGRAHHMVTAFPADSGRGCYMFGGRRSVHGSMDQACLYWEPAAGAWTEFAPMPHRRGIGRAVTAGGLVYVLGGCVEFGTGLPVVEAYDPAGDSWFAAPNLPDSLHDFVALTWRDSLILVMGGGNWAPTSPPTADAWLFNPAAGSWVPATPLPLPLGAAAATITGDDLYIATGWTDSGPTNRAWHGAVNPDRPQEITWDELDTLPAGRRCRAAGSRGGGRFAVVGGITASGAVTGETWEFEPATRRWSRLPDKPTPSADVFGAAWLGGMLAVPGGYAGSAPYSAGCEALYRGSFEHDVATRAVVAPVGRLHPSVANDAAAEVVNYGTGFETLAVTMRVTDTLSGQLVFIAESSLVLAPGASRQVHLGRFVPDRDRGFRTLAWTTLVTDQDPTNDTACAVARTTAGSDPDGFGYTFESTQEPDTVTFRWETGPGETLAGWAPDPDDGSVSRLLPFPFPFYGETLSVVSVSVDGFLAPTALVAPLNASLPDFELAGLVAPFWDDLTLRAGGAVIESHTSDSFCLTWSRVPRYGQPSETLSFQVCLARDGGIRVNLLQVAAGAASSTVGIQGGDGGNGWFIEYAWEGEPARHRPGDSVSVVFHPPRGGALAEAHTRRLASPLFPSPWSGRLLPLSLPDRAAPRSVAVYDAAGRRRVTRTLAPGVTALELVTDAGEPLVPGAYFIVLDGPASPAKLVLLAR